MCRYASVAMLYPKPTRDMDPRKVCQCGYAMTRETDRMPSVVLWESGPQLEARQGGIIPPLNDIAACKNRQQNIDQNEEILGVITLLLCLMYRKETQTTTVFQEQNMLRRISTILPICCMHAILKDSWLVTALQRRHFRLQWL